MKKEYNHKKRNSVKESPSSLENLDLGDSVHIKSLNKTGMYYGEEGGKVKVRTPDGIEKVDKSDIEVILDDDYITGDSLSRMVESIENRILESEDELDENLLRNAALATLLGLGSYAGLEMTSAERTPLGKAMHVAAQQGDEYAKQELRNLNTYLDAGDTRMITKLSNKYLGPLKDRPTNEATSYQSNLDPENKVVVKGVKGMNSKSFTKTFSNMKSAEKWMDDNEGDVEIKQIENEDSVAEAKHNSQTKDKTMSEATRDNNIYYKLTSGGDPFVVEVPEDDHEKFLSYMRSRGSFSGIGDKWVEVSGEQANQYPSVSFADLQGNSGIKDRTMNETKLTEGIIDRLRNIVDDRQMSRITFDNGETLEVDMQTANAIVSLYNAVNNKNKAKIEDKIGKKEMFQKLADFAFQKSNSSTNEDELTEKDEDDPCWDGYEQYGMKTKDGEEVPNCVPVSEGSLTKEEKLLAAMKDSTIAESMGMSSQEARDSLRSIYGYDDLAIARAQLDETTSAGSVAAVSAPIGDTKKRNMSEEEMDNKDSDFDSAWFYKDIDDIEGPYDSESEAKDATNDRVDWVKQGKDLDGGDRRLAKRAFLMKPALSESRLVSTFEKKFRSQLNEAMNLNVSVDPTQPESRSITITASEQEADELAGLLSNAGLFSSPGYGEVQFQDPVEQPSSGCGHATDMPMEDDSEYSNSPEEKHQDMEYMLNLISGGINREKNSYDKAEDGDNPMDVVEEEVTDAGTIDDFHSYVLDFYGPGGIYDFGATEEEVKKATEIVRNEVGDDFEGDSVDREKVRDVILDQMRSEEERKEAEKAFGPKEEIDPDFGKEENAPDPIQTRGDVDDDMDRMRNFNETDEVKRLAGIF